jgi:predicted Zn finger-like uncharacterized protein
MNLVCPSCDTRFSIGSATIKPGGRMIKCGRCQNKWRAHAEDLRGDFAEPPAEPDPEIETEAEIVTEPEAEILPPVSDDDGDPPPVSLDEHVLDAPPEPIPASLVTEIEEEGRKRGWIGWIILLIVLAALTAGAVFLRPQVIAIWPPATKLYDLVDGLTEDKYEGLDITATTESGFQDGRPILTIKGEIVNNSKHPKELALLRIALHDKDGKVLHEVKRPLAKDMLPPNERLEFSTVMPNPPQNAIRISVTFIDGG